MGEDLLPGRGIFLFHACALASTTAHAAQAAVSVRKVRLPMSTALNPMAEKSKRSDSVHPRSLPIAIHSTSPRSAALPRSVRVFLVSSISFWCVLSPSMWVCCEQKVRTDSETVMRGSFVPPACYRPRMRYVCIFSM